MGGATFSLPEKDRNIFTRSYCHALLCVCLGGRLAEEIFCNDVSSGAAADISHASEIARRMVLDWGMSDKLGFVRYSSDPQKQAFTFDGKDYSDKTAETIDQEILAIMERAQTETRQLLDTNRENVENIAQAVLKYETLSAEDVQRILDGQVLDKPTVGDLISREKEKDAPEPRPAAAPEPEPAPEIPPPLPEPG